MKRPTVLFPGDSITEGFNDYGLTVSCGGPAGRLMKGLLEAGDTNGPPPYNFINLGQSGFMPRQYMARARGFINADPAAVSICAVSVWSPNQDVNGDPFAHTSPERLADDLLALEEFEAFCVSKSVVFMPVFWCASPFNINVVPLTEHVAALGVKWPWFIDAGVVIRYDPLYVSADTKYCVDATHPSGPDPYSNANGYALIGNEFMRLFPTSLAMAKTHYGF